LEELRRLVDSPDEQANYATTLLNPRLGYEVIQAALHALSKTVHPPARPALLQLYAHYDEKGSAPRGRLDPAANLRAAILRTLRPLVVSADVPLLVQAASTYVFPPPAFKEEGAMLRSAALNALSEVDETLARYHAVRLLANEHTDPMSGEPALSAARLLGAYEESMPLYFYVMQDGAHVLPEVLSECLRHLTVAPEAIIPGILDRYADSASDVVLVGLFDLLLNHRTGPHGREFLRRCLHRMPQLDAYRYLVTVMAISGRQHLLDDLLAAARVEHQMEKMVILHDALAVLDAQPVIASLLADLQARLGKLDHKDGRR
jgi:hypothetical protein